MPYTAKDLEAEITRNNQLYAQSHGIIRPIERVDEPDDFTEICSQCGNAHDDDALRCPSCGFAFLDDERDSDQGVYHRGRDQDLKHIEEGVEIDAINRSLK